MLNFKAASFDELVVPVSQGKVFLLLEAVNPVQCDELDYFQALLRGIGVRDGSMLLDDFLSTGYLAAEAVVSDESEKAAGDVVDYFRQRKFRGVVKASLFVDGRRIEHSEDELASTRDVLAEFCRPGLECKGSAKKPNT